MNNLSKWTDQLTMLESQTHAQLCVDQQDRDNIAVEHSKLAALIEFAQAWLKAEKNHHRILCSDHEARICELLEQLDDQDLKGVRRVFTNMKSNKN